MMFLILINSGVSLLGVSVLSPVYHSGDESGRVIEK